jgi:phosphoserine phosphatase RsbU/P
MRTNLAKLPYLLLAILVVGSTLFYAANTAAHFDSFLNPNRARPPFVHSNDARFLVQPLPESKRAGMAAEDEVISVNGVPFTGMAGLIRQAFYARPGQIFSIVYRNRLGGIHTAQVGLMAQRRTPPSFTGWLINIVLVLLFPAFCLLLGYWVVLARPFEWNAWFLLGIMNVVPAFISRTGYFPGFLAPFTIFWQAFAVQWMLISLILFSIYFPVRSRTDIRHPWIKWLIIVPQIALVPAQFALAYGRLYHVRFIQPYLPQSILFRLREMSSPRFLCASSLPPSSASSSPFPLPRRMPAVAWEWWPLVRSSGLARCSSCWLPPPFPKKR